jgi:hypothetical protein
MQPIKMEIKKKFSCDPFKTGYLDESGDDGQKGSKWFIMAYICTNDGKRIAKILKKTKEQLRRSKKGERWLNRLGGEIKFAGFPDEKLRLKLLEELSKVGFEARFIAIKKDGKNIPESEKSQILLNLLAESFINHQCMPAKIIADKDYFKNKKICSLAVKNYEETIYEDGKNAKASYEVFLLESDEEKENCNLSIKIKHENSKEHPELQAVDLISGALFHEFEKNNKDYTNILRKNLKIKGLVRKIKK